nr:MAG TPA: hypothetical protein [Caudoviricetes sp.]
MDRAERPPQARRRFLFWRAGETFGKPEGGHGDAPAWAG